jgi:hypothetical protein
VTRIQDITIELDGPHWLVVSQEIPALSPDDALRWFVEPGLLTQWWGQAAHVEPEVGGRWEVRWPAMAWTLRGQIAELSATSLIVSWAWDHESDLPARALIVRVEASGSGATLRIMQGPYRQGDAFPREEEDRASHREGWEHFLPVLATQLTGQRAGARRPVVGSRCAGSPHHAQLRRGGAHTISEGSSRTRVMCQTSVRAEAPYQP